MKSTESHSYARTMGLRQGTRERAWHPAGQGQGEARDALEGARHESISTYAERRVFKQADGKVDKDLVFRAQ